MVDVNAIPDTPKLACPGWVNAVAAFHARATPLRRPAMRDIVGFRHVDRCPFCMLDLVGFGLRGEVVLTQAGEDHVHAAEASQGRREDERLRGMSRSRQDNKGR